MNHQILRLVVSENRVRWERLTCELDGTNRNAVDESPMKGLALGKNDLVERTILLLSELQQLLGDVRRATPPDAKVYSITDRVVEMLGEHLYQFLFVENLPVVLRDALSQTQDGLLRIELEFQGNSLTEYGSWPWEYLRRPKQDNVEGSAVYLALETQLVLNRRLFLEAGQAKPRALKSNKPVVLLVVAGPPGRALGDFGEVQAETVIKTLKDLHKRGVIELLQLVEPVFKASNAYKPTASWSAFKDLAEKRKPDVIHFIGHGRRVYDAARNAERSELVFVGEGCAPDPKADADFVKAAFSDTNLKLIFLQACESALPGPYASASNVGQLLAGKGIPAVVAMQAKIENMVANTFAKAFYTALSEHNPVDWAVRKGREAIEGGSETLKLAFGVPVVYLRSYDALIERKAAAEDAPARRPSDFAAAPLAPERVFEACPRCDRRGITDSCANCKLRVVCKNCEQPLALDAKAPKLNPMRPFCANCGADNPQDTWTPPQARDPARKPG